MTAYKDYLAIGECVPRYSISLNETKMKILEVEALKIDDVVKTCLDKGPLRAKFHSSRIWQLLLELGPTYAAKQGVQKRGEGLWRSVMAKRGNTPTQREAQYPAPPELQDSFHTWILWRYALAVEAQIGLTDPSAIDDILPTRDELTEARQGSVDRTYLAKLAHGASLFDLHYSHAVHLRPFRTRQSFFGIGTQCLREGDSLWIVQDVGCLLSFVAARLATVIGLLEVLMYMA